MIIEGKQERFAGVLLHPTSLPGVSGIGDMGYPAREFIDFLAGAKQSLWQICPLGPTGYGDSPYSALSAFAGNPLLISLELLMEDGLMDHSVLERFEQCPDYYVDYGFVIPTKVSILRDMGAIFMERASESLINERNQFCADEADWLEDYTLFITIKNQCGGSEWTAWEPDLVARKPEALDRARKENAEAIEVEKTIQFLFFRQWRDIKAQANARGIHIIGDVPIFLAHDSADVWANQELFFMDETGRPTVIAGVPPDYFSDTGQRWGNPIYRWPRMAQDGYAWWVQRIRAMLDKVDVIRLDHFRGFEAYWEVPAAEETAINGRWVKGPGAPLFKAFHEALGHVPLIAEDLGLITAKVHALRKELGMPGMKVLQFAFGEDPHNLYLPHNAVTDCVVYTGTHDNDTTLGWYQKLPDKTADHVRRYLWSDGKTIHIDLLRAAWMSSACMAIAPMQDILGLDSDGRMNAPGAPGGNWQWRMTWDQLHAAQESALGYMTELYGRALRPEEDDGEMEARFNPDLAADE